MTEEQVFSRNVDEMLKAFRLCRLHHLYIPALLLAYAGIDILASLDPPEADAKTRKKPKKQEMQFTAWVEKYLLPGSELAVNAIDLYAARCAVVHTFGPESNLASNGNARRLVYTFGASKASDIQRAIQEVGMPSADIAVHIDAIFDAFEHSVWVFRKAVHTDPNLRERVERNSRRFFSSVSYGHGFSILDIRMRY